MTVPRNPLQPLTVVVRLLWSVTTAVSLAAITLVAVASYGTSVCITAHVGTELIRTVPQADVGHLSAGSLRVCLSEPTTWERVLYLVDVALPMAGYALLFLLLMRLLERGAVDGVHTAATADRLRRLGWFTLVAVPAVTLTEAAARLRLLAPVLPEAGVTSLTAEWDVPWWAVVSGLGLLALGKIMRTSAEMRADLEGTV
ncbi:DUF2975 domain-containing protein [Saccharothrix sp. 6-C]|uniref:DUF2975 domain-containing protein n=1 Tax=Saccharothrix sp. 6-C TaxID=2781735 RepID=UPI001916FAF3|nr:DUF2975 domain-containing protein [Saccharothrix sp. 6-C]QQQ77359.1 DUF2975 domain-containing protein [Saccharothrix sp. 6-C]